MSMPDKIYAWGSKGPEVIASFLKPDESQIEYIRADLVNDLIDSIGHYDVRDVHSAIKAIRGEQ